MERIEQYGAWLSPISAEMVSSKSIRFTGLELSKDVVYWSEQRPSEKGRVALITNDGKNTSEILNTKYSVRTRVHEYGGVPLFVFGDLVFFISDHDQGIYQIKENKKPIKIFSHRKCRFADVFFDKNSNLLFAVKEETEKEGTLNSIVAIDLLNHEEKIVAEGRDFYSNPRVSPDGKSLSYLCWDHPNMPWDKTILMLHSINESKNIQEGKIVAGLDDGSIFQPEWSSDNTLYFISDRNGWWNLYRYKNDQIEPLWEIEAEFGLPQWIFGLSTYGFIDIDTIACIYFDRGKEHLGSFKISTKSWQKIDTPFHFFNYLKVNQNKIAFVGSSPLLPSCVATYDIGQGKIKVIRSSQEVSLDPDYISEGKFVEFSTVDNKKAYAYYYPPKNKEYKIIQDQPPPLIVKCHGGPTSFSNNSLNLQVQYWTSRGFAYVDVNYGGSSGFGREYRQRLNGKWGIVDVQDCAKAVEHLVNLQLADPARTIIKGGSAGGFTVLASLVFTKIYKAGASYYGVSDLESLIHDTHKFELHYLDNLVGKYPDTKEKYFKRSPINHVQDFASPVIFFQGSEDKVVPPEQSEKIFLELKKKKIMTAYVLFEDEQHGFRKADSIKKSLEAELYFYSRVFQFAINDNIKAINIEN